MGASPLRVAWSAWQESVLLAGIGVALGASSVYLAMDAVLDWFFVLDRPPNAVTLVGAVVVFILIVGLGALPVRLVMAMTPSTMLRKGRV